MKFTETGSFLAMLIPLVVARTCKPPVESQKYQDDITAANLMANLQALNDIAYANGGNRAFGYPGYAASVDWIYGEVSKLKGFKSWTQDFPALYYQTISTNLSVEGQPYGVIAPLFTPSTPKEGVTLQLVHGPAGEAGCALSGYNSFDVAGKIVLIDRFRCPDATTFAGRIKPAAAAGAKAVIIYNFDATHLTGGTLTNPNPVEYVPSGLIDQAEGLALKARLDAGESLTAYFQVTQIIEERITQNVFAETTGGDAANVIMLGAHLDSVPEGPGINDDGSGTSLVLELTKALSHYSTKNKVRFAWWGAEENGKRGSLWYCNNLTAEEGDNILAYLNFDMVAKGYFGVFDGDGSTHGLAAPPGSDVIEKIFVDDMVAKGVNVTPAAFTNGSDYFSFWDVLKKPIGGLHTGTGVAQDSCYHKACDNITNPVPETIATNAKAAAHVLSILATDGVSLLSKRAEVGSIKRDPKPVALDYAAFEAMGERHLPGCDHHV